MIKFTIIILFILLTLSFEGLLYRSSFGDIELEEIVEFDGDNRLKLKAGGLGNKNYLLIKNNQDKKWYTVDNDYIYLTSEGSNYVFLMKENSKGEYDIKDKMKVVVSHPAEKFVHQDQDIASDSKEIALLASKITSQAETEVDKALLLYEWIIANLRFDYNKYENHLEYDYDNQYGSLNALNTGKGVCYDYATLYAAFARSQGIPTKVVEGYYRFEDGSKEFHAWNQVYVDGRWINIDTTVADTLKLDLFDFQYGDKYSQTKEY